MSLSIGIVGLPNVGKSTLFNALSGGGALVANYPFATIDPNIGVVPIPDPRLKRLAEIMGSSQVVPATVRFVDIAGLVRGASEGEGLGNQFLANIRDVDAVCEVVRVFASGQVSHVEPSIDPARDIEIVATELALADLETVDRRLERMERQAKSDRSLRPQVEGLARLRREVGAGRRVSSDPSLVALHDVISDLRLLTAKPVIYVFNCDQAALADTSGLSELASLVDPAEALFLDLDFEAELVELENEDKIELLAAAGLEEPGLDRVIHAAYRSLGLQSFLTANPKEAHAWTIKTGATAFDAAGVVHSDFQRGFIAAEVVDFEQLDRAGSWSRARADGVVRTEGKSYMMRPGDVVEFRFNV